MQSLSLRILANNLCRNTYCLIYFALHRKFPLRSEARSRHQKFLSLSAITSDNEPEQISLPPSLSLSLRGSPAVAVSTVMTHPHPLPAHSFGSYRSSSYAHHCLTSQTETH